MTTENPQNRTSYFLVAIILLLLVVVAKQAYTTRLLAKQVEHLAMREERFKNLMAQQQEARLDDADNSLQNTAPGGQTHSGQSPRSSIGSSAPAPQPPSAISPGFFDDDEDRSPFEEMNRMRAEMNQIFGSLGSRTTFNSLRQGGNFSQQLDLKEDANNYLLKMELPGIDPGSISVAVENGMLEISAKREQSSQSPGTQANGLSARAHVYGSFSQAVSLPGPVKKDELKTSFDNGILTVTLPKAAENEPTS